MKVYEEPKVILLPLEAEDILTLSEGDPFEDDIFDLLD